MKVKSSSITFSIYGAEFPQNTEVEKAAYCACRLLGRGDCKITWQSSIIRELRRCGYSKSTAYRALDWLEKNGVVYILRNHWGNVVQCKMMTFVLRDFWMTFVLPF